MSAKPHRVQMTVELDVTTEPVSGVLDPGHGAVVEFAGWMELMSAMETACAGTDPRRKETDDAQR